MSFTADLECCGPEDLYEDQGPNFSSAIQCSTQAVALAEEIREPLARWYRERGIYAVPEHKAMHTVRDLALKAAYNCRETLEGQGGRIDTSTGALLLYQNLISAGYDAFFSVGDTRSSVRVTCTDCVNSDAFVHEIDRLLEDMVQMFKDLRATGFTVENIKLRSQGEKCCVEIQLIAD